MLAAINATVGRSPGAMTPQTYCLVLSCRAAKAFHQSPEYEGASGLPTLESDADTACTVSDSKPRLGLWSITKVGSILVILCPVSNWSWHAWEGSLITTP